MDFAVLHDLSLSRDQIKDRVLIDLKSCASLLQVAVHEPTVTEAIVDVFWERYQLAKKRQEAAPELDLKPSEL